MNEILAAVESVLGGSLNVEELLAGINLDAIIEAIKAAFNKLVELVSGLM